MLEDFVIRQVRITILEESNLKRLVALVNRELASLRSRRSSRQRQIERNLAASRRKLDRLYALIEDRKLDPEDVAPRIRFHLAEIAELEQASAQAATELLDRHGGKVSIEDVRGYALHLHKVIEKGQAREKKRVLVGFVKSIVVRPGMVEIEYRLPTSDKARTGDLASPVLDILLSGGASATLHRTFRLSVPFWGTEGATNSRRSAAEKGR
jgi:hypothetical protein